MDEQFIFYIIVAISVITALASIATLNIVLISISSLLILLSVIIFRLWDVVTATIFRHTNLIQLFNGYELSRDRSAAVCRQNGKVAAMAAAVFETVGNDEIDRKKIENIIANVDYQFRFVISVEKLNVKKLLDRLKTKRSTLEIEMARLDPRSGKHSQRQARIRREMEQLDSDINSITGGESPLRLVYYLMTNAVSESTYGAEERAKSQVRDISGKFDALLGSRSRIVTGEELLATLKIDAQVS